MFRGKSEKNIKKVCKNCILYNKQEKTCGVTIIHEGERLQLTDRKPDEKCFFEEEIEYIDTDGKKKKFKPEVGFARFWAEDPITGKPSDKGKIKIEYTEGFFGDEKQ